MARCPNCRKGFREPEDEQGEHDCPYCGLTPDARQCASCGRWGPSDELKPDGCCEDCTEYVRCDECGEWVLILSSAGLCEGCVMEAANDKPEEGES